MHYTVLSLITATLFAANQILTKLLTKHSVKNAEALTLFSFLGLLIFGVCLAPFTPLLVLTPKLVVMICFAAATFSSGFYLLLKGMQTVDVSAVSPLFVLQSGLIGIWAFIFLGERFPLENYLWLGLMLVGAVLVSVNDKLSLKAFMAPGVLFILATQVLHSLSNLTVSFIIKEIPVMSFLFWQYVVIGCFAVVGLYKTKSYAQYAPKQVGLTILPVFIMGVGVISLFTAYTQNVTVSSVLSLMTAPLVLIFSIGASAFAPQLLEHHPPKVYAVRAVGLAIILLSVLKVAMGAS